MPTCNDPCLLCGRQHNQPSLFCSDACERASERERRRQQAELRKWTVCEWCGWEWRSARADAVYCSGKCRTSAYRARRGQGPAAVSGPPEIEVGCDG
jgi:predicted nucleic acid-binding Zn ribbon protein